MASAAIRTWSTNGSGRAKIPYSFLHLGEERQRFPCVLGFELLDSKTRVHEYPIADRGLVDEAEIGFAHVARERNLATRALDLSNLRWNRQAHVFCTPCGGSGLSQATPQSPGGTARIQQGVESLVFEQGNEAFGQELVCEDASRQRDGRQPGPFPDVFADTQCSMSDGVMETGRAHRRGHVPPYVVDQGPDHIGALDDQRPVPAGNHACVIRLLFAGCEMRLRFEFHGRLRVKRVVTADAQQGGGGIEEASHARRVRTIDAPRNHPGQQWKPIGLVGELLAQADGIDAKGRMEIRESHARGFLRGGVSTRLRHGFKVRHAVRAGVIVDHKEFAAPEQVVRAPTEAVKRDRDGGSRMVRFDRRTQGVVMLNGNPFRRLFAGVLGGEIAWMRVECDGSRIDLEYVLQMLDALQERFVRGEVGEVADMVAEESVFAPGDTDRIVEFGSGRENFVAGGIERQLDWNGA